MRNDIDHMNDEQLLDLRLCDLRLKIRGTPLEHRIDRLYVELREKGVRLRPHVWLSEDWFTPDKISGFAIPFYLAHSRMMRLERKRMLTIEGGVLKECMQILRHEAGHAVDNAYRLHSRPKYKELFGSYKQPYPDWYKPEPNSRDFVLHLPAWYAQAHPAEDFAETFAVWLGSETTWRREYIGSHAYRKLEYVDSLMTQIRDKAPLIKSKNVIEPLKELTITLREHYLKKQRYYDFQWSSHFDRDLFRIFTFDKLPEGGGTASGFLRRIRRELCREVADGTGVHVYAIDQMLHHAINRCNALKLYLESSTDVTYKKILVFLTVQTINGIRTGYHRIAL